jgi:hypothetical protein
VGWDAGSVIEDQMGLLIPIDLPPGDYQLVLGVYPTGDPQMQARLPGVGLFAPGGTALLGSIQAQGHESGRLRLARALRATFADNLELLGCETDLDFFQIGKSQDIHPMLEETITLTFPREAYHPGETIHITLYWRVLADVSEDYGWQLELIDKHEQVVAKAEGPLRRRHEGTSAWREGELAITPLSLPLSDSLPLGKYELRLGLSHQLASELVTVISDGRESTSLMLGQVNLR